MVKGNIDKPLYKVMWKAKVGFKSKGTFSKREWNKKQSTLKKQGKWFRAWKV